MTLSNYVNGNDDFLLRRRNNYYRQIQKGRFNSDGKYSGLKETIDGTIAIADEDDLFDSFLEECELSPDEDFIESLIPFKENGLYVQIKPNFGEFSISMEEEEITVFGIRCKPGFENEIITKPKAYADIYLSHLPPKGVLDLSVKHGIEHIGSQELRDIIAVHHPKVVICGHTHMWGGLSKKVGDTHVLNVSSQDSNSFRPYGNFAFINTDGWSVKTKTKEMKELRPIRGVSALRGDLEKIKTDIIGIRKYEKEYKEITKILEKLSLQNLSDINNQKTVSNALLRLYFLVMKNKDLGIRDERIKRIRKRIESLDWEKPKVSRRIHLNPDKHAFVDVETGRAQGINPGELWLIGLWYNGVLRQFHVPRETQDFVDYLKKNQISSLVSWSQYDRKALQPLLERKGIYLKYLDAYKRTANCVIWYTYKLHELHKALLPRKRRRSDVIPGRIAGLYADHIIIPNESCPYCPSKESLIEDIKKRNKEDILHMLEICRKLWEEV